MSPSALSTALDTRDVRLPPQPPRLEPLNPHAGEVGEATLFGVPDLEDPGHQRLSLSSRTPGFPIARTSSCELRSSLVRLSACMVASLRGSSLFSPQEFVHAADSSASSRKLSTHLPKHVRRGVRLDTALSGFGRYWVASNSGGIKLDSDVYGLSQEVETYSAFLSHDWYTPYLLKVTALMLLFNCRPAAVIGFFVAILTSIVETWFGADQYQTSTIGGIDYRTGMIPWTFRISTLVYLVTLCVWQRVQSAMLGRANMVFFDKICISQTDQNLQKKGILGLAGFLRHSKNLVVLWSPRYFSRLWCTFELASWMFLGRNSPMVFPVNMSPLLLLTLGWWTVSLIQTEITKTISFEFSESVIWAGGVALNMCFTCPCMYMAGRLLEDIKKLPEQLEQFSINKTACYCCANNHKNPDTGKDLFCDRLLVYKTLESWFDSNSNREDLVEGDASHDTLDPHHVQVELPSWTPALDRFDEHVKSQTTAFTQAIRCSWMLYQLSVCTSGAVYWFWACGEFAGHVKVANPVSKVRVIACMLFMTFLIVPLSFALMLRIARLGDGFTRIPLFMKVVSRSILHNCFNLFFWLLNMRLRQWETPIPQVLVLVAMFSLTVYMFKTR